MARASLSDTQWEFLQDIAKLILHASFLGVKLTGGELYRPERMQKYYVKIGKSTTMKSQHLKRLACDFNFFVDGDLIWEHELITELGEYWESLHPKNKWGGHWKKFRDTPHFQRKR